MWPATRHNICSAPACSAVRRPGGPQWCCDPACSPPLRRRRRLRSHPSAVLLRAGLPAPRVAPVGASRLHSRSPSSRGPVLVARCSLVLGRPRRSGSAARAAASANASRALSFVRAPRPPPDAPPVFVCSLGFARRCGFVPTVVAARRRVPRSPVPGLTPSPRRASLRFLVAARGLRPRPDGPASPPRISFGFIFQALHQKSK